MKDRTRERQKGRERERVGESLKEKTKNCLIRHETEIEKFGGDPFHFLKKQTFSNDAVVVVIVVDVRVAEQHRPLPLAFIEVDCRDR